MTCRLVVTRSLVFVGVVALCGVLATSLSATPRSARTQHDYSVRTLPLPDDGTGDVSMDYIAFDPTTNSLWVPAGNTGAVDVVDVASSKVRRLQNLPTAQTKRAVGGST